MDLCEKEAERLTKYNKHGLVVCNYDGRCNDDDCIMCPHFADMRDKLAIYEDKEERNMIPERYLFRGKR